MSCRPFHDGSRGCSCHSGCYSDPALWSKKKKLETLNNMLDCFKNKQEEIEQAIAELNKQ